MEASKKEANVLQTYEELKTEFEKRACRIDDVLLYPVLDTKNERTLYTLLQLKERFSHLKYSEGKTEHKFVQEWADDPNKKAFRKMDVVPKDCPPDVYKRENFTLLEQLSRHQTRTNRRLVRRQL